MKKTLFLLALVLVLTNCSKQNQITKNEVIEQISKDSDFQTFYSLILKTNTLTFDYFHSTNLNENEVRQFYTKIKDSSLTVTEIDQISARINIQTLYNELFDKVKILVNRYSLNKFTDEERKSS